MSKVFLQLRQHKVTVVSVIIVVCLFLFRRWWGHGDGDLLANIKISDVSGLHYISAQERDRLVDENSVWEVKGDGKIILRQDGSASSFGGGLAVWFAGREFERVLPVEDRSGTWKFGVTGTPEVLYVQVYNESANRFDAWSVLLVVRDSEGIHLEPFLPSGLGGVVMSCDRSVRELPVRTGTRVPGERRVPP